MKQAVIGSRSIKDFDFSKLNLTDVVSGGAIGIDSAIRDYCIKNGIPIKEIKPNYDLYGWGAPIVRNRQIVNEVDVVYAIWDGVSKGTLYVISYARHLGKKVEVIVVEHSVSAKNTHTDY